MNATSLIPIAAALYYIYSSQSEVQEQLQKQIDKLEDKTTSDYLSLQDDINRAANVTNSVADDFSISPVGYFHSMVNMYWDSAYFVTIKNNSNYVCYLRGVRMTYNIEGNVADFKPYFIGNKIIQPGGQIEVRLGGTNNKCLFLQKAVREQVRQRQLHRYVLRL